MDKIIALPDWVHIISLIGCDDNGRRSEWYVPVDLKDITPAYINEHFGQLQDEAYKKGFENGKAVNDKGCEGCECETHKDGTCIMCSNNYMNLWEAKQEVKQTDECIKVGDEIKAGDCKWIVTANDGGIVEGIDAYGNTYSQYRSCVKKTGRHFDIDKILKEMKEDF